MSRTTYPPEGMTRSLPVDRCCPLYRRIQHHDTCTRKLFTVDHYRVLLMGCPVPCPDREEALKAPGARAKYEECLAWQDEA